MKRTLSFLMFISVMLVMLSGCSLLQSIGLQEESNDELRPVSSIVIGEDEASRLTDKTPIRLYFANKDNTKLKLEIRYIDSTEAKKSTSNLASAIVHELIKGPSDEKNFNRTIPTEAKLRTPVSISNKVATVDMSKEFKTKHPGGKDAEKMTIYSIVNSLTELEDIQKVKFTIDGKAQKEFMGNFQFNSLFPRSTQLISKEAVQPAAEGIGESNATEGNAEGSPVQGDKPASGDSTETSGQNGAMDGQEILE
ncbi:MAG: GerMN domain-containing protein [Clostridiaceae bacterium]